MSVEGKDIYAAERRGVFLNKVRRCSRYMVINLMLRVGVFHIAPLCHQCGDDGSICPHIVTAVVKPPALETYDISDAGCERGPDASASAEFSLFNNFATTQPSTPMTRRLQSRSKLQIAVFFLILLSLLLISLMFPCKHCQEEFSALSLKGLKLHQKKCPAYLSHEEGANNRRKAAVESKKVRRKKIKESRARLGSAVPGVSLL